MVELTPRECELVAIGAAIGSNCVPCIEYHIPEAKKAGLSDAQIRAAIQLADKVRQVPARKVLNAALSITGDSDTKGRENNGDSACAGVSKKCC